MNSTDIIKNMLQNGIFKYLVARINKSYFCKDKVALKNYIMAVAFHDREVSYLEQDVKEFLLANQDQSFSFTTVKMINDPFYRYNTDDLRKAYNDFSVLVAQYLIWQNIIQF